MVSAEAAIAYFTKTDTLASCPGDWLGKGAQALGLNGTDNQMHFWSLAHNLHPQTGESLTTYTREGRRVGVDFTFNSPKSVGLAREMAGPDNAGDPRVEEAHREAVSYTVGLIESDMQARVRAGGENGNRTTGNLVAFTTADTVTTFLNNEKRQAGIKNGVIWVDEAGQLPIRDLSRLVDVAQQQNARLVLQGDPKQHRSVARDGNMLNVLQSHAGLPAARLKDICPRSGLSLKRPGGRQLHRRV